MTFGLALLTSAQAADLLDPDGKPADMSKPVKVYILVGQSNMVGAGKILGTDKPGTLEHATRSEKLYPFLVDDVGSWTNEKTSATFGAWLGRAGACSFSTTNG